MTDTTTREQQRYPTIDPRVRFVGVSSIRDWNVRKLQDFAEDRALIVVQCDSEPLSVLIPYAVFQEMQADLARYQQFISEATS